MATADRQRVLAHDEIRESAAFIRDACVRLNDARAVALGNTGMLAEELTEIEAAAVRILEAQDGD